MKKRIKNILKVLGCIVAIVVFIIMMKKLNNYEFTYDKLLSVMPNLARLIIYNNGIAVAVVILMIVFERNSEEEDSNWKIVVPIIGICGIISFMIWSELILIVKILSIIYFCIIALWSWQYIMAGIGVVEIVTIAGQECYYYN